MNQIVPIDAPSAPRSVLHSMADRYGMEPQAFEATLRGTVVPQGCTKEQFAAFLLVAREYKLNPVTKEIYAFPAKGGGIQPIVSIDGWMNLINSHPQMDGLEFDDHFDDGRLQAITARIWRKDRAHAVIVTEYMNECRRDTPTWKQWPARMLRHKAAIQAARYAFGFAGIADPDEHDRAGGAPPQAAASPPSAPPPARKPPAAPPQAAAHSAPPVEHNRRAGPPSAPSAAPPDDAGLADGDGLLATIDDDLAACRDEASAFEIWDSYADLVERLSRSDRERAATIFEKHAKRIGRAPAHVSTMAAG